MKPNKKRILYRPDRNVLAKIEAVLINKRMTPPQFTMKAVLDKFDAIQKRKGKRCKPTA